MAAKTPLNILVRMPNWLGDCIMALPAMRHLIDALPDAKIYLAGRRQFRDLFTCQPGVAGFVEAPGHGVDKLIKSMFQINRQFREAGLPERFDLGLLFTNSLWTAIWLLGTGAAARVGYNRNWRRFLLTHPVPCGGVESSWHFIRYYMWLAKFAESVLAEADPKSIRQVDSVESLLIPSLAVSEATRAESAALLKEFGIVGQYAVIAPASAYGAVKDWPPEHYRELVGWLNCERGLPVLVSGGAGQADVCTDIARDQQAAWSIAGRTNLTSFAALIAGATLFAGGDSGGAHVAAALGTPTLVIFGITNPTRTSPTGLRVRMIGAGKDTDVKLSTSEAREAARLALAGITPDMVKEKVRELSRE